MQEAIAQLLGQVATLTGQEALSYYQTHFAIELSQCIIIFSGAALREDNNGYPPMGKTTYLT